MQIPVDVRATGVRARPLSLEERQASIIDAVIPLLAVHGRDLTSKQIAEAAGIAEGTVFRAFGDKDSLITAAVAKFLDPAPLRHDLRAIDPALPLEEKVLQIITLMQHRFSDIFRIMALVGNERPPHAKQRQVFAEIIGEVLAPDLERLNWPAIRIAHIIRLVAFAAAFPQLNDGVEFSAEELTAVVLFGITGQTVPTESQE